MKEYREKQKALTSGKPSCKTNGKANVSEADKEEDKEKEEDIDKELYVSIVSYLNERAGTKYKHSSSKTKTVIHARLAEGFTLDDFKTVIDKKCAEWIGNERMEKYLRPETLFGTKFESYLNQKQTSQQQAQPKKQSEYDNFMAQLAAMRE
jgi:uncharacterized phage protein (TIGR02220 family)